MIKLKIYKTYQDDALQKSLNSNLQNQLDLTQKNYDLRTQENSTLIDQNNKLMQAAQSEKGLTDLEKGLFFLGGVLVTGLAVKAAASLKP